MKRLSIIISLILCLALCACGSNTEKENPSGENSGSVFAETITYNSEKAEKRNFANTYKKLTVDKKLNVAYIGGSVTVGTGSSTDECWRSYTTDWFEENYPDAEITETNAAIGATGAVWGLTRIERDVISKKPDLVFVEFSVNDSYENRTYAQSAAYMDGIVRRINKELPNTDIVIVSVVDSGTVKAPSVNKQAHADVASYYGLEYIDFAPVMTDVMAQTGNDWSYYVTDIVHPNAKGYRVYADHITSVLVERFREVADKNLSAKPHKFSDAPFCSATPVNAKTYFGPEIERDEKQWPQRKPLAGYYNTGDTIRGDSGSELTIDFEGTTVLAVGTFYTKSKVEFCIDGKETVVLGKLKVDTGFFPIFDNLTPGKHRLTVKVTGDTGCSLAAIMVG